MYKYVRDSTACCEGEKKERTSEPVIRSVVDLRYIFRDTFHSRVCTRGYSSVLMYRYESFHKTCIRTRLYRTSITRSRDIVERFIRYATRNVDLVRAPTCLRTRKFDEKTMCVGRKVRISEIET